MKILLVIPLIILITGCPGKGKEGAQYGEIRAIDIDGNRICFSMDKKDVLESYTLSASDDYFNKLLRNYTANLSYPDTCFTVNLEKAEVYGTRYKLNQKWYHYSFIIDNDGQAIDLGGMAICPFPGVASNTRSDKD